MKAYDIVMMGHISKDIMVYKFQGSEERLLGGAVVYSSAAAARSGARVLVLTKAAAADRALLEPMRSERVDLEVLASPASTSIRNVYLSEDRERREVSLLSEAAPFAASDVPAVEAKILHLAGLFYGEIPVGIVPELAGRFPLAVDAQGLLRRNQGGRMSFHDLENKAGLLKQVRWLKTDAAEAEVLTGTADREKAAGILAGWGPREVMVTHNSEVLVLSEGKFFRAPFTPRNLSGRTGRGDTCFASYLYWRLEHGPQQAVEWAAALTSIKMETPGPFRGGPDEVRARMMAAR